MVKRAFPPHPSQHFTGLSLWPDPMAFVQAPGTMRQVKMNKSAIKISNIPHENRWPSGAITSLKAKRQNAS